MVITCSQPAKLVLWVGDYFTVRIVHLLELRGRKLRCPIVVEEPITLKLYIRKLRHHRGGDVARRSARLQYLRQRDVRQRELGGHISGAVDARHPRAVLDALAPVLMLALPGKVPAPRHQHQYRYHKR
eukprot:COSAG01_NODE_14537_length_1440_cov_10.385965_1_plen_128_part_00